MLTPAIYWIKYYVCLTGLAESFLCPFTFHMDTADIKTYKIIYAICISVVFTRFTFTHIQTKVHL